MGDEFLNKREVMALLKVSRSSMSSLVKAGEFPAPLWIGPKSPRWPRREVIEWMESRPREKVGASC